MRPTNFRNKVVVFRTKTHGIANIKWFLVANTALDSWVLTSVFLNFSLLTVTKSQFGLYSAIAILVGIVVEIPSGTLADNLGRKKVSLVGFLLLLGFLVAWLLATILNAGVLILAGIVCAEIGIALLSGSLEALAYDSLKENHREDTFDELQSQAKSLQIIGLMVATLLGGILWQINVYLPVIANIAVISLGIFSIYKMEETQNILLAEKDTSSGHEVTLFSGFTHIHRSKMKSKVFVMAVPAALFILWGGGLIQLEVGGRAGLSETSLAMLLTILLFINYATSVAYKNIRKKLGDRIGFFIVNTGMAVGCVVLAAVAGSIAIGILGITIIRLFGKFTQIWPSSVLNESAESNARATIISTFSLVTRIPYLCILPLYMSLGDLGKAITFLSIGLLLAISGLVSFYAFKREAVLSVNKI